MQLCPHDRRLCPALDAAAAPPPHIATAIARAARRREKLERLSNLGMDLAQNLAERAAQPPRAPDPGQTTAQSSARTPAEPPPEPRHEPGRAFAAVSRAVRLTLALEAKIDEEILARSPPLGANAWRPAAGTINYPPMIDELYSTNILRLAANMPRAGRLAAPDASAERVARLCGSRIVVDVRVADGKVADFAQEVKACALGQAAAAVLGANVIGATCEEIAVARDAFRAMLKAGGPPPTGRFSDLSMLEPVKDYPQRHASSLLAFEATVEACRLAQASQASPEAGSRTSPADAA